MFGPPQLVAWELFMEGQYRCNCREGGAQWWIWQDTTEWLAWLSCKWWFYWSYHIGGKMGLNCSFMKILSFQWHALVMAWSVLQICLSYAHSQMIDFIIYLSNSLKCGFHLRFSYSWTILWWKSNLFLKFFLIIVNFCCYFVFFKKKKQIMWCFFNCSSS